MFCNEYVYHYYVIISHYKGAILLPLITHFRLPKWQMLVQIRRALTVSDQTRLRQLVAPRQGLLPIRILERQSGQRRRQPRYRARAPHVGSLAASVGLSNQRSRRPPGRPLRSETSGGSGPRRASNIAALSGNGQRNWTGGAKARPCS